MTLEKGRRSKRPRNWIRSRGRPSRGTGISRATILEATRRLYTSAGYTGVTLLDIAKAVGCRSPSLYHHFPSKDAIFRALVHEGLHLFEQYQTIGPTTEPLEQLRWRFLRYYEFSKAHPDYFALVFVDLASPTGDDALRRRVLNASGAATRDCVHACIRAGVFPPETDARDVARLVRCAAHGAAVLGLQGGRPTATVDELAHRLLDLTLDGIRAGLLVKRARAHSGEPGAAFDAEAVDGGPSPGDASLE